MLTFYQKSWQYQISNIKYQTSNIYHQTSTLFYSILFYSTLLYYIIWDYMIWYALFNFKLSLLSNIFTCYTKIHSLILLPWCPGVLLPWCPVVLLFDISWYYIKSNLTYSNLIKSNQIKSNLIQFNSFQFKSIQFNLTFLTFLSIVCYQIQIHFCYQILSNFTR